MRRLMLFCLALAAACSAAVPAPTLRPTVALPYARRPLRLVISPEQLALVRGYGRIMTDTAEDGFCANVDLVPTHGDTVAIVVRQLIPGVDIQRWRDSVHYSCPPGWADAHWHLAHLGHPPYASEPDILNSIRGHVPIGLLITETQIVAYMLDTTQVWRR